MRKAPADVTRTTPFCRGRNAVLLPGVVSRAQGVFDDRPSGPVEVSYPGSLAKKGRMSSLAVKSCSSAISRERSL